MKLCWLAQLHQVLHSWVTLVLESQHFCQEITSEDLPPCLSLSLLLSAV